MKISRHLDPFKRIRAITVVGCISTAVFLFLLALSPAFIEERIESVFLDLRFHVRNAVSPPPVPDRIVIVEIDEKSLERYGRWPWSRVLQARLIRRVLAGGPAVLAVDIFYPERENPLADRVLARALRRGGDAVVLATGFDSGPDDPGEIPDFLLDSALVAIRDQSRLAQVVAVTSRTSSIPVIASSARLGHVYSPADQDGKLRWEMLSVRYRDEVFPSLSLMTAARAQGAGLGEITLFAGRGVQLRDAFIPTDSAGRMLINYLGGERTLQHVSAADVLSGVVGPERFAGRIVFLGTTALATFDFVVTPFSARMPGIEKNAMAAENILNRRFLRSVPVSIIAVLLLASGLALSLLLPRVRALPGILLSLALLLAAAGFNQYLFLRGWHGNFVYPFSNLALISVFAGGYKYLIEERRARELKRMFSHYVSPKIVEQLIARPELTKLGGHRREVTVLFSDVRGFTSFSERRQPEEVVDQLNEYLQEMTDIIFKWDGTLDKFVGDEIMAFWGAPLDQPDHAVLAVRCALNMSARLDQLREQWIAAGKEPLDNGIGLNTGDVLVGNIGSADKKMDYTIIGDHVNLGARVEALTRKYDSRILITEFTWSRIRHAIDEGSLWRVEQKEIDMVQVKGKAVPVRIYGISTKPRPAA